MIHRIQLANTDTAPTETGEWIKAHCTRIGMPESDSYQVITCLVEAVNNAVAYGLANHSGEIVIKLHTGVACLVLQIRDNGPSAEQALLATAPDPDSIGGRGWFIINQWMDVARYRRINHYNIVTLARHLPPG
jgi:serine/threonine-protein kinase RsbW